MVDPGNTFLVLHTLHTPGCDLIDCVHVAEGKEGRIHSSVIELVLPDDPDAYDSSFRYEDWTNQVKDEIDWLLKRHAQATVLVSGCNDVVADLLLAHDFRPQFDKHAPSCVVYCKTKSAIHTNLIDEEETPCPAKDILLNYLAAARKSKFK